jgi:phage terminase large subunit GpA-like protein
MTPRSVTKITAAAGGGAPSGWHMGLELPPRQTISQWADAKRQIARGTGPEPGRWRTDRTPYLREPMDAPADPDIEIVVLKMSSQVGKTEVLINALGYYIDQDPAPQMLVLPTLELAESFSTKRFVPTCEATPALAERIGRQARTSANTILEKAYPGGDVVFAGANSPASLASRPRRIVMFDEIDKYKANIGADGDPIKQGFQRAQNFWNRKKILASTPTLEGFSHIEDWFRRSDQRHFEVPCHACGAFQALEWEQVRWTRGDPATARYHCPECDAAWDQRQVQLAVRHGHWRPRAQFNGIAGFYCWAIYSPWVTMAELAAEWEEVEGKPAEEQTFINLKLGRTYNPTKGPRTTPEELYQRREDYGPQADGSYTVPDGVLLITAHVDVQHDRWEAQYLGWGAEDVKWVLDYARHYADTSVVQNWRAMEAQLLTRTFRHPTGHTLYLEAVAIDAGYQQQLVLEFVREAKAAFKPYYAVRGVAGEGKPIIRQSDERFKFGAKLHLVGVDDGKTLLFQELAAKPDPDIPGSHYRVHFPRHLEPDYFEQLVGSERLKVEFVGGWPKRRWVPVAGRRNEALDTFVGAMAARYALSIDYEARRRQLLGEVAVRSLADLADVFQR